MPGTALIPVYAAWALMTAVALGLVYVAIAFRVFPSFLIPLAAGMIIANLPAPDLKPFLSPFLNTLQAGLDYGIYPSLIFLGLGAGMDLSYLIAHPRQLFLGLINALAFLAILLGGTWLGLSAPLAACGALIGGGDGLSTLFLSAHLARDLLGPAGLAAFALVGLVPRLQPPLVRLLTTRQERRLHMPATRKVSRRENILFAAAGLVLTALLIPGAMLLTGMLFLGNLIKEAGMLERLGRTLANRVAELTVVLLGLAVGTRCTYGDLVSFTFLKIIILGLASLTLVTIIGVAAIKAANLVLTQKINPLVGAAGLGLIPDAAQMAQIMGRKEDPQNNLYYHALASSQAGLLTVTLTAGLLWSMLAGK